jgi:hypothetical protein
MKQMELMMSSNIDGSVQAVYRKTGVLSYDGNPLIECLPRLGTAAQVMQRLNRFPKSVIHSSPEDIRASELIAALSNTFVALPQHYDLASFIDNKIKQGYISRNPNLKLNPQLLQSNYERMLNGEVSCSLNQDMIFNSLPSGILYGIAGYGKTTTLGYLLSYYPHVIIHDTLNLTQISYLYINFPHDGSLKTLCKNFFDALNSAIKKPNTVWLERSETLPSMLAKMQAAAVRFNIGILVIDEFQIWRTQTKNSDQVIGFLVSLINTIKLPIIFSGTHAAKGRLESNLAMARRVTGFDVWDPLRVRTSQEGESKKLWDYFVRKLWQYQYLSKPSVPLTPDINDAWFDCSQGILDIAVKLYIQVQLRAIHSKKEEISADLIRRVYKDDFKPVHAIVGALRSKDPELIAQYEDLPQSKITATIASLHQSIIDNQKNSVEISMAPVASELLDCLIQIGYTKSVVLPAVELAFSSNPTMDKKSLLPIVIQLLASGEVSKGSSTSEESPSKIKTTPPQFDITQQHEMFSKFLGKNTE